MSEKQHSQPFKQLGDRLKTVRQRLHESVAEVSGAVEIDEGTLQRIEQGQECPSEDILMLLISHFGMHDDEASGLWQLAGYDQPRGNDRDDDPTNGRATILVMAVDPRVIYSDGVQVGASKNGVVISFSQHNGGSAPLTTAKIGMSRDQAEAVISALQDALRHSMPSAPRQLSDGASSAAPSADKKKQA